MGTTRQCLFCTVTLVLIVALGVTSTNGTDADHSEEINNRISTLEEGITQLRAAVLELDQQNNKMKKLIIATLNVAMAPEEQQCEHTQQIAGIVGELAIIFNQGHGSCALMGTALYPAASCSQLHEACNHPSGNYFVKGVVYTQVYCEMDEFGGGWTRFGKGNMESVWNYDDETEREVSLTIISAEDIKLAMDLSFNTFKVLTDVLFRLQADDSTNPSSVETRSLPWMEPRTLTIMEGRDHTRLELTEDGDRLACFAGGNSKCGQHGLPLVDQPSDPLVITSLYFGPRAVDRGATARSSTWSRNRYTWSGSFYYLLAK